MSDFDLEGIAGRIKHLGEHIYLCERTSYTEMCNVFFVDFPALVGRIEELEARVAELEPDARLGRAVWEMDGDSLLLNGSGAGLSIWARYENAKVEWLYGDRYAIHATIVTSDPGEDTPQAALGMEEEAE
jgi:hypothetical protein